MDTRPMYHARSKATSTARTSRASTVATTLPCGHAGKRRKKLSPKETQKKKSKNTKKTYVCKSPKSCDRCQTHTAYSRAHHCWARSHLRCTNWETHTSGTQSGEQGRAKSHHEQTLAVAPGWLRWQDTALRPHQHTGSHMKHTNTIDKSPVPTTIIIAASLYRFASACWPKWPDNREPRTHTLATFRDLLGAARPTRRGGGPEKGAWSAR